MAYMEIFGNCTQNNNEFLRYSVPAYSLTQTAEQIATHNFTSSISHSQTMTSTLSSPAHTNHKPAIPSPLTATSPNNIVHGKPPALPPKSVRQNSLTHRDVPTPPSSPKPPLQNTNNSLSLSNNTLIHANTSPVGTSTTSSPVLKISPVRLSYDSNDDRGGYEHLCDATTTATSTTNHNSVNNNNSLTISPNSNVVVVTNNSSKTSPSSPSTMSATKVTVSNHDANDDEDQEVVLRRNNPREKVLISVFSFYFFCKYFPVYFLNFL